MIIKKLKTVIHLALRTISDLYAAVAEAFKLRTRFPDGLRLSLVGGDRLLPGLPLDTLDHDDRVRVEPRRPGDDADNYEGDDADDGGASSSDGESSDDRRRSRVRRSAADAFTTGRGRRLE